MKRTIDRNALFSELRDRWIGAGENRNSTALAEEIGTSLSHVSDYANGHRSVPEWLLLHMLDLVGVEIVVTGSCSALIPVSGRHARGDFGPYQAHAHDEQGQ